jgi:hypothetical protein
MTEMKVFLSAVSCQFEGCRDAIRSDLSAVGVEVVLQEDFQQGGGSLLEKLERHIASCDRIIALVGDVYGHEPDETAGSVRELRRSYSQWEYFFARGERLDGGCLPCKDILLYFASAEFLVERAVSQPNDEAQLQREFIETLRRSGKEPWCFAMSSASMPAHRGHGTSLIRPSAASSRAASKSFRSCTTVSNKTRSVSWPSAARLALGSHA